MMPATLTHLLTGQAALSFLEPVCLPAFWLGCVVPDAPNLDGFASKETRWNAHLRDKDLERWMGNVTRFLRENEGHCDHSYLLGYAVHVTGDVIWDEVFEKKLQKGIHGEILTGEERFTLRWNEHYRFEQEQLTAGWWLREIKPQLAQAETEQINGLSTELVRRYRDYLLTGYDPAPDRNTIGLVTMELVQEFGHKVVKKLREYQIGAGL